MASRAIYDLSHCLDSGTQVYPGDTHFSSNPTATIEKDGFNLHKLSLGTHTGTHIDAPYHFIPNGATVEQIALSQLLGPAVVIDLSSSGLQAKQKITWGDLKRFSTYLSPGVIVLICTGWYEHWGKPEYYNHPYFTKDVSENLLAAGVRVVCVDTLNPDETVLEGFESQDGFGFHESFLGAGGIIAENLTNLKVVVGIPNLCVSLLPLKIVGSDGSPVRAVAWQTK